MKVMKSTMRRKALTPFCLSQSNAKRCHSHKDAKDAKEETP